MARGLFMLFALLAASAGCVSNRPAPVPVRIIDAETKMPVAGAEVRLWNPDARGSSPGRNSSGVTDPDGVVYVRCESKPDEAVVMEVKAAGYWSEQADFKRTPTDEAANVVEVFSGKRPSVEFLLPVGFRGPIKARIVVQDPPPQSGQREFSIAVPSNGAVQIVGSPILKYASGPTFRAKFANGEPVPTQLSELQVGLRWLQVVGDMHYFVVGTQADWNAAHAELVADLPNSPRPASKGNGGGGGGRGGRGGRGGGTGGRGGTGPNGGMTGGSGGY
jgi:hypothetical protein